MQSSVYTLEQASKYQPFKALENHETVCKTVVNVLWAQLSFVQKQSPSFSQA